MLKFNPLATTIRFQLSFGVYLETLLVGVVELLPSFQNLDSYPNDKEKRSLLGQKHHLYWVSIIISRYLF